MISIFLPSAHRGFGSLILRAVIVVMLSAVSATTFAAADKAASYYEDALRRYEKNDMPAAIIQLKNAIQQDPKLLAAHLLLGKALLRDGNLKAAEAAFDEALKQGISRGEIAVPMAQILLALGRPEVVIDRVQASGLSTDLQVEVLTLRGNAYLELRKTTEAMQSFDQARSIDPRSPTPLVAEVFMLLQAGKIEQAKVKAEKALELAPKNPAAWSARGSVLHATLDTAGALAAYNKAIELNPNYVDARISRAALLIDLKRDADAAKDLDTVRPLAPDEPRAAYLRAVVAGIKGDSVAANDALKEVVSAIDPLPVDWLARREQLLMTAALAHYSLGNFLKSREYLDTVLSRNASNIPAKKLMAAIFYQNKDYSRAESQLQALMRLTPDDPQVLHLQGLVNMAQKRYAKAADFLERAASKSGSADMNRSLGMTQLQLGKTDQGLSSLEKAFSANPGDIQSGMALAATYARQGKKDRALKITETMVKRNPDNLVALNFLGALKGASGDKQDARTVYLQVLARDSDFIPAILNLVRIDVSEKRYDDARKRLDATLKKHHDDYQVSYEYAQLELRAGKPSEAIRHLTKAVSVQRQDSRPAMMLIDVHLSQRQADQALAAAKAAATQFPSNLLVQLALARAYLANNDVANARNALSGATRLADYDPDAQVAVARLQMAAGNPDGASYNIYKALQGNPDSLAALILAVQVEIQRGDLSKADAALKMLSGKYPNAVETIRSGAELAAARGRIDEAIAAYRKILAREENSANAIKLAELYLTVNEAPKAVAILEARARSHPDDVRAQNALAETQFRAGQLQAARQTYQRMVTANPDDTTLLNNYANLLSQMNDPSAQEFAERTLKLAPNHPAYADTLGWILVGKGQHDAALRYLREARLRAPENGEIRFHLAYALTKVGRLDEARQELQVVLGMAQPGVERTGLERLKKELGI